MTVTTAAMVAEVPYGTAMRRVTELLDEGYLIKRPKSKSGKSFSLNPTKKTIQEFEQFAFELKKSIAKTFGLDTETMPASDLYFGGAYMASRILSYPSALPAGAGFDRPFRILCPIDPTFRVLSENVSGLRELSGTKLEIVNLPLHELHAEIQRDKASDCSEYDLFAVDLPWIGELAKTGVIAPLNEILMEKNYNPSDFHSSAYMACAWKGAQYGLPIQPTVEFLLCREDIYKEAGLKMPETLEEVLAAAQKLHRSRLNLSGIVMNFQRGLPVAHSFIQTLADFGQPFINLPKLGDDYVVNDLKDENYRPMLDTPKARETAEFLLEILQYSHPESLNCNWDRRIKIFAGGHAAMSYGWSVRASVFEFDATSPAYNNVAFVPHPHGPDAKSVTPVGGYAISIPANLPPERMENSWRILEYLTSPEIMKWYAMNGSLTSPRYSTSADPEVQATSKMIGLIDRMERVGDLQIWPRAPIAEFNDILKILGEEIYLMLQGQSTIDEALSKSQNDIDKLMRAHGRYN